MNSLVFDRKQLRVHKERALRYVESHDVEFLLKQLIPMVLGFSLDILDKSSKMLILGCHTGLIGDYINKHYPDKFHIIQTDFVESYVRHAKAEVVADEEFIPFAQDSFDIIICIGNLHWVNDLPGCFVQISHILKEGGTFIGNAFGTKTLREMRSVMVNIECEKKGLFIPRISPFIDIKDVGGLLQRAKFNNIVVDTDDIIIHYQDPKNLLLDIHRMGESNSLAGSNIRFMSRDFISDICDRYRGKYSYRGSIEATFEVNSFVVRK